MFRCSEAPSLLHPIIIWLLPFPRVWQCPGVPLPSSFLWDLPASCFPNRPGRPSSTAPRLHDSGPLGPRAPPTQLHGLPHPLPLPPLHLVTSYLTPFPTTHPLGEGGVSVCFLFLISLGRGCKLGRFVCFCFCFFFLRLLGSESPGVLSVTHYPCPPDPLLMAFVSFLAQF